MCESTLTSFMSMYHLHADVLGGQKKVSDSLKIE